MKKSMKVLIPIIIVLVLIAAYVGGFAYYGDKYLPNTSINGGNYGGETPLAVKTVMENMPDKNLVILGKSGQQEEIKITQSHYVVDIDGEELSRIQGEQIPYAWFIEGLFPKEYIINNQYEFSQEKMQETINKLGMVSGDTVVEPADAYILETESGFSIVPEVEGNKLYADKLTQLVIDTMAVGGDTIDLVEAGLYHSPKILATAPQLTEPLKQLAELGKLSITYDFVDRQEVLDYEDFSKWVTFDTAKGILVEEEKAAEFVQRLSAKYDTAYATRQFNSTGLGTVTVSGGIYGWQTDIPATTKKLIETIQAGESVVMEPIYRTHGLRRTVNDIGNTYIEIDLTRQTMWYYVNGELYVETGIVSGLPGGPRETPTGTGSVWSKEEKRFISGTDYKLWVEYWIPIDWTGVGIHDASWQPFFGGTRYLVGGSHGCINTPYEKVAQIFKRLEINTPVVIYKS